MNVVILAYKQELFSKALIGLRVILNFILTFKIKADI